MKSDMKSFFLNVVAGLLTYYVTKYLDANKLPILSYLVFGLYIVFILSAFYFHFQQRANPQGDIIKDNSKETSEKDKEDNKPKIFHDILQTVAKLASQHADSSPATIGKLINEDPNIVLAHLRQMEDEALVVYANGGKPPELNTSFFIAYHDNPWKYMQIKSS